MTAIKAGAPIDEAKKWSSINWKEAERQVRRLQMRIAKAVKENRWHKVKALQHLLTRSFYAKLLAVKRVTSNKGKKTPGVDGVLWKGARAKWRAACSLRRRGYKALALRRIYIPKKNGKKTPSINTCNERQSNASTVQTGTGTDRRNGCRWKFLRFSGKQIMRRCGTSRLQRPEQA